MSEFERDYKFDPKRERDCDREKHPIIEMPLDALASRFIYNLLLAPHEDKPEFIKELEKLAAPLTEDLFVAKAEKKEPKPKKEANAKNSGRTVKKSPKR